MTLLNQSQDINIDGINGSLSNGFDIKKIHLTNDLGNINSLDDIKLHYKSTNDSITITEFHVGNGYFYVDFSYLKSTSSNEDKETDTSKSTKGTTTESSGINFNIEKISINNVTLEDSKTGTKFKLDGLQINNLKHGNNIDLGQLLVESSSCNLEILPIADSNNQYYTVKGLLKPSLHKKIL